MENKKLKRRFAVAWLSIRVRNSFRILQFNLSFSFALTLIWLANCDENRTKCACNASEMGRQIIIR